MADSCAHCMLPDASFSSDRIVLLGVCGRQTKGTQRLTRGLLQSEREVHRTGRAVEGFARFR